jgi:allophanate hydrolase
MASASFTVAQAGPLVTIQDKGRAAMMRFGVPASGPMDRASFAIANAALGNPAGWPAIEISMGGLALDCTEGSLTIAVAGGGFRVEIDGVSLGSWIVATIRAGSRLVVRPGHWGSWTYLAFAGRLRATPWLGSLSTHALTGLGGGRLSAGQHIEIDDADLREPRIGEIPCPVSARPRPMVKVVLGPQDRFFAPESIETLLSQPFTLTDSYDRMGVRLAGPSLRPAATLDMPSEPILRGSIQVAGDGVPTVLLADHQTTGGYPKIATVVSHHLDGFVQLRSRAQVAFAAITPQAAVEAARTRHLAEQRFLTTLQAGR